MVAEIDFWMSSYIYYLIMNIKSQTIGDSMAGMVWHGAPRIDGGVEYFVRGARCNPGGQSGLTILCLHETTFISSSRKNWPHGARVRQELAQAKVHHHKNTDFSSLIVGILCPEDFFMSTMVAAMTSLV